MQYRRVGRTDLHLSTIGFGTAQFPMLPPHQAIASLQRGFELGVNWVHVSHEYGDAESLVARAVRKSGKDIAVLAQASGDVDHFAACFERTCEVLGRRRLDMFGINCINDCEYLQQDVWGPRGMAAYLARLKREGRIRATFCTTHGQPDDIERVVRSGCFDAVMMAYNPAGFHLFTYYPESLGRTFEDISQHRPRVFPVALEHGVSVLVMKALAGGLLCKSKALPPHEWLAPEDQPLCATDLLKHALDHPAVCAVVVGTGSVEEAEENARAGYEPIALAPERRAAVERAIEPFRTQVCSRCGKCESTCSHGLPIATMFRDVYVWNHRSEPSMPLDRENYFLLHPDNVLTCVSCTDQSCLCPQGMDIPRELARADALTRRLQLERKRPGSPEDYPAHIAPGTFPALVLSRDVPERLAAGASQVCRLIVQNAGHSSWRMEGPPQLGVYFDRRRVDAIPVRHDVPPGTRTAFAFELHAPSGNGPHQLEFRLGDTSLLTSTVTVHGGAPLVAGVRQHAKRILRRLKHPIECLGHDLPQRVPAGTSVLARLTVKNASRFVWRVHARGIDRVSVESRIDGELQGVHLLPSEGVKPGDVVTFHIPLRAPAQTGEHVVELEIAGRRAVTAVIDVGPAPARTRAKDIAAAISPWSYAPSRGIDRGRDGQDFPFFVSRAKGSHLWDQAGTKYIDYIMGWGTALLGYADDRVQDAVRAMLGTAPLAPFPYELEMDVARMITEDFPSAEMVIFGKNGSDVCTVAARLARAITGRRMILFSGYHGWQDFWVESVGSDRTGVPDRPEPLIHHFRHNDRTDFFRLLHLHRHELAAVMIEPSGPWGGDDIGPESDADRSFLADVADETRKAGGLLIYDEIVTGYRYPGGSVQRATGVVPDLTCLGKAIAAGMPLSALAGRADLMRDGLPRTHYGPTFRSEAYSLAAAKAAIEIYRTEPVADHVWAAGTKLRDCINRLCRELDLDAECKGPPFRIGTMFRHADTVMARKQRRLFSQELLKRRITTLDGVMLPSYAHDEATIEQTMAAIREALEVIARARRASALDQYLEIPV